MTERITTCLDDFSHHQKQHESLSGVVGCPRVNFTMAEIRSEERALSQQLQSDPFRHIRALEAACHSIAQQERPGYDKLGSWMTTTDTTLLWCTLHAQQYNLHNIILLHSQEAQSKLESLAHWGRRLQVRVNSPRHLCAV